MQSYFVERVCCYGYLCSFVVAIFAEIWAFWQKYGSHGG